MIKVLCLFPGEFVFSQPLFAWFFLRFCPNSVSYLMNFSIFNFFLHSFQCCFFSFPFLALKKSTEIYSAQCNFLIFVLSHFKQTMTSLIGYILKGKKVRGKVSTFFSPGMFTMILSFSQNYIDICQKASLLQENC